MLEFLSDGCKHLEQTTHSLTTKKHEGCTKHTKNKNLVCFVPSWCHGGSFKNFNN
jgi:hypothetical protein